MKLNHKKKIKNTKIYIVKSDKIRKNKILIQKKKQKKTKYLYAHLHSICALSLILIYKLKFTNYENAHIECNNYLLRFPI